MTSRRMMKTLWSRSLQFRVVVIAVVFTTGIIFSSGLFVLQQIQSGLLRNIEEAVLDESHFSYTEAQRIISSSTTGVENSSHSIDLITTWLVERISRSVVSDIFILSSGQPSMLNLQRGTNYVLDISVPRELREKVENDGTASWMYSTLQYFDGRQLPGIISGYPITLPSLELHGVYLLFSLEEQEKTLTIATNAVIIAGGLLTVGVGLVTFLIMRSVLNPIRKVSIVAQRFRHGSLDERLEVTGSDDVALLSMSFNSMAESIQRQIQELENLSQIQQNFVSDVSHELRAPMSTVRVAADLVHKYKDSMDPLIRRSVELLHGEIGRLEEMVSDLLEISKFDAGVADLAIMDEEIQNIITSAIKIVEPAMKLKGVNILFEKQSTFASKLPIDGRRIKRVLVNLFTNALEYGDGKDIKIIQRQNDDVYSFLLRDFGGGITSEQAIKVFTRFWRADESRSRHVGGSGLGLSISLNDILLHYGLLDVSGKLNEGCIFRLCLWRDEVNIEKRKKIDVSDVPLSFEEAWRL